MNDQSRSNITIHVRETDLDQFCVHFISMMSSFINNHVRN